MSSLNVEEKTFHMLHMCSLCSWRCCVGVRLKFWQRSRVPKKGVGTGWLKYRLPENPGILNRSRAIHMSIMLDDPLHIFPN